MENDKKFMDFYDEIAEQFDYRTDKYHGLVKSLMILDIIREGRTCSVKDALNILEDAKDILLEYKIV